MRQCIKCLEYRNEKDMGFHLLTDDWISEYCKQCQPKKRGRPKGSKRTYISNIKEKKIRTKLYKKECQAIALKYKQECIICYEDDPAVLHYHHIKDKKFSIAKAIWITECELLEEISKCVVLCANCHSKYHIGKRFSLLTDKPT